MNTLQQLFQSELERFEKECVYHDGKKGKVYADVAKSFLLASNQRVIDEVVKIAEGMKKPPEELEHDLLGKCGFQHNITLNDLINKLKDND